MTESAGMWVLVLAALLSESPPLASTAVVVPATHGSGYSQDKALALARRVALVLAAEGVAQAMAPDQVNATLAKMGAPAPSTCEGHKDCIAGIGHSLGVGAVIAVEPAQVQSDLAIHLEALASNNGQRLAKHSFVVSENVTDAELSVELRTFAGKLKVALTAMSPPPAPPLAVAKAPPSDAPLAEVHPHLVAERPRVGIVVVKSRGEGLGAPVYVLAGGTVAAGTAAAVMAAMGLGKANSVSSSVTGGASTLTLGQAQDRIHQANTLYTASLVSAIFAGACAAGSAYFFAQGQ